MSTGGLEQGAGSPCMMAGEGVNQGQFALLHEPRKTIEVFKTIKLGADSKALFFTGNFDRLLQVKFL